jgi:hypothetical protein
MKNVKLAVIDIILGWADEMEYDEPKFLEMNLSSARYLRIPYQTFVNEGFSKEMTDSIVDHLGYPEFLILKANESLGCKIRIRELESKIKENLEELKTIARINMHPIFIRYRAQLENELKYERESLISSQKKEKNALAIAFSVSELKKYRDGLKKTEQKNEKTTNNSIKYDFSENPEPTGTLKMGTLKNVKFDKMPAKILNYFYLNNGTGNNYKDYKNFNECAEDNLNSDKFNKIIDTINKRVIKETTLRRVIIESGDTKTPKAKIFRWNNLV